MIIIAGHLVVDAAERADYLDQCHAAVIAARSAAGCLDFHLSADHIEPDRINVYEAWESSGAAELFRGDGPDDGLASHIRSADIRVHEISSSTSL